MTRALVLAAGMGTRLSPLTDDKPKAMVSFLGRPLIERQLEVLRSTGIEDIAIIGGFRSDRLQGLGVPIVENRDYQRTNMVASMMCGAYLFDGTQDLVVSYGDILYEKRVLDGLLNKRGEVVVSADKNWLDLWRIRMNDPLEDAETFSVAGEDRIKELGQKPRDLQGIEGQYMGLNKFSAAGHRKFISHMEKSLAGTGGHRSIAMTDLMQNLIDHRFDVRASWTKSGWIEVDTIDDHAIYESLYKEGTLARFVNIDGDLQ